VLRTLADIALYGRPDDYPQQRANRIGALTLDALKQAIAAVQPGALTWIIVGDLQKIEKPVRALELGDLKVVDADGKVLR
jgi:predicted Zn-dependent peptidase